MLREIITYKKCRVISEKFLILFLSWFFWRINQLY